MTATPTTRYASGPRGALAYQVTGTGRADLLAGPSACTSTSIPSGSAPRVARPLTGWASLTDAETRVATLAADGYGNPAIARELFLSRATIETHLKRVYAKLAMNGRRQLHLLRPPAAARGAMTTGGRPPAGPFAPRPWPRTGRASNTRTRERATGARTAA